MRPALSLLALGALAGVLVLSAAAGAETSDATERREAAEALGDRAEAGDPDAIAALVPLLHSPDAKVRYHAEWGLARAGANAVPGLIREFRRLEDDEARGRVAQVLGRIGLAARAAIPELLPALADPDSRVAGPAAYALGAMRAREALPELVAAYAASRDLPNQRQIQRALHAIGSDQSARAAKRALVAGLTQDLDAADRGVRGAALVYVRSLYPAVREDSHYDFPTREELGPLIPGLVRALDDPDAERALHAIRALALAGRSAAAAAGALERRLEDPQTRNEALGALRAIGSPAARDAVTRFEARAALERRIRSDYTVQDHQGRTRLLPFRVLGSAEEGLRMETRFLYPGKQPSRPDRVVVSFESTSADFRLAGVEHVDWVADGTRVRISDLDRTWSRSRLGVIEHVSGSLPLAEFLALASARELRARLGPVEFSVAEPDRAALRHFAGKIPAPAPTAPDPAAVR